jgi:hypothetical protein
LVSDKLLRVNCIGLRGIILILDEEVTVVDGSYLEEELNLVFVQIMLIISKVKFITHEEVNLLLCSWD